MENLTSLTATITEDKSAQYANFIAYAYFDGELFVNDAYEKYLESQPFE